MLSSRPTKNPLRGAMPSLDDVTVIVCSRNRADMLREALTSIASSTSKVVEVMVVDSGSETTHTRDVALAAGSVYVRSEKGLSIARNAGLAASSRPIVVYTDDDCRPTAGWIEALLQHFGDDEVSAVTGWMLDHTVSNEGAAPRSRGRFVKPISGIDAGHGAVMAFRRDVLLRLGGFDDVMGAGQRMAGAEDLDIFVRLLRAGTTIVHESSCVVQHANTRVGDDYVALHLGYGRGLGALEAKLLRIDPILGIRVSFRLAARTLSRIVRSAPRRAATAHDVALLRGMCQGIVATWRLPIIGERFVPPWQSGGVPRLVAATPHTEEATL
jgi:glycosyltransferase involved in cell wall biosynthesis